MTASYVPATFPLRNYGISPQIRPKIGKNDKYQVKSEIYSGKILDFVSFGGLFWWIFTHKPPP